MKPTFLSPMQTNEHAVRAELSSYFRHKKNWAKNIHPTLVDSFQKLEEFMLRGGKFVRPFLTSVAYTLATDTAPEGLAKAGAAVEVFKNYVLNIDDMADRDVLRHGGPTLEVVYQNIFPRSSESIRRHYGRSFSEVVGGMLATGATELILGCEIGTSEQRATALLRLEEHLLQITAAGWQIHFHQNIQSLHEASEAEFLLGLELVNSHYTFIGPLLVGTALSGNTELDAVFTEYGKAAGLAFQLHDDYLGLFGDTFKTGKAVGNDIREGKKTVLLQAAYRKASASEKEFLAQSCGNELLSSENVVRVQEIVKKTGALEYSQTMAKHYADLATSSIRQFLEKNPKRKSQPGFHYLLELAEYVIARDH